MFEFFPAQIEEIYFLSWPKLSKSQRRPGFVKHSYGRDELSLETVAGPCQSETIPTQRVKTTNTKVELERKKKNV